MKNSNKTIVEKIVDREINACIILETENVIVFADHDPINFGHLLICPKMVYQSILDLPIEIHQEIQSITMDLYKRIEKKFNPDGITLMQNNGFFNELNHYHLHIFPRFKDDQFGWETSEIGLQSQEKLKEVFQDF